MPPCPVLPHPHCPSELGANTQATTPFPDCGPQLTADFHLPISGLLPKHPLLTVSQHRNGLRAGHMSWKAGGEWERRLRRLRTCDGLRPTPSTTPTLWNLPGTDLQGSGTISFSSSFFPLLQARPPLGQQGAGTQTGTTTRTRRTSAHVSSWSRESYVIHQLGSPISPPTSSAAEKGPPPSIPSLPLTRPCYSFFFANPIAL
jgi:hypothetical protein